MSHVGAFEAKTRLSQLLEKVAKGEEIVITKHGMPVAALVPVPGSQPQDPARAIAAIKSFRRGRRLDGLSFRRLIEEGRA